MVKKFGAAKLILNSGTNETNRTPPPYILGQHPATCNTTHHKTRIMLEHIVRKRAERLEPYRIVDAQFTYGPKWFKADNYELHGYLAGERVDMIEGLTLEHFDELHYISRSRNAKNDREFVHVVGTRYKDKKQTVLILKVKL
jgi:hypothetical protein